MTTAVIIVVAAALLCLFALALAIWRRAPLVATIEVDSLEVRCVFEGKSEGETLHVIGNVRTDLFGAAFQGVLITIFVLLSSGQHNIAMQVGDIEDEDFGVFTSQTIHGEAGEALWSHVGTESSEDHGAARLAGRRILFPARCAWGLGTVYAVLHDAENANWRLDGMSLDERTSVMDHPSVKAFVRRCSGSFLKKLPPELAELKSQYVAIHYRAGEITDMPERFLHSRSYAKLLRNLKRSHPELPVLVFTSKIPPPAVDDMRPFRENGAVIFTSRDSGTLQTVAAFLDARILVLARSSFSYSCGLLRDRERATTFYRAFWHKQAHRDWTLWD